MSETMTMLLSEFLLARIAEDEAWAQEALDLSDYGKTHAWRWVRIYGPENGAHHGSSSYYEGAPSPARVLAECEAKRRIVEWVSGWGHETVEDCWYSCPATFGSDEENAACREGPCECGLDYRRGSILGQLALPYADHPDYREEWRP